MTVLLIVATVVMFALGVFAVIELQRERHLTRLAFERAVTADAVAQQMVRDAWARLDGYVALTNERDRQRDEFWHLALEYERAATTAFSDRVLAMTTSNPVLALRTMAAPVNGNGRHRDEEPDLPARPTGFLDPESGEVVMVEGGI